MSQSFDQLLKDATDYDPDKRFMAANDLCNELLKENKQLETGLQRQILGVFLQQLDDSSIDVQGNAVRCIKRTVSKIQESQTSEVITKLGEVLMTGKAEFRDIYATCLKGLISDVPNSYSSTVTKTMLPILLRALQTQDSQLQEEAVDIMTELFRRFAYYMHGTTDAEQTINSVFGLLTHEKLSLRKKACQCIGAAALILPSNQLQSLVSLLISRIQSSRNKKEMYTYIQAISAISRTVGSKLSNYLNDLVPILMPFCDTSKLEIESPEIETDHELIEICLSALESFIRRCPKEVADFVPEIFKLVMELISYDPNYSYAEEEMEEDEDWGSDFEESEELSDAGIDDSSWKVRRAAVHVLDSIIRSRPEKLSEYYSQLVDKLVERFREREENVKLDIFKTFSGLIRSILVGEVDNSKDEEALPTLVRTRSSTDQLRDQVPLIIQGVQKELSSKNPKTKQGVTSFLMEMALSLPENLCEQLPNILDDLCKNLQDLNNSNLRIDTLVIFKRLFRGKTRSEVVESVSSSLIPQIQQAIKDEYFKISAEGLRVAGGLVRVMQNKSIVVSEVFPLVLEKLSMTDIDQEVKQASIFSTGLILSDAGQQVDSQTVSRALELVNERMKNEVTRLTCLKAWSKVCEGTTDLHLNGSPELSQAVFEMSALLKKNLRALQLSTLETLLALVKRYNLSSESFEQLSKELYVFINDSDLHLAQNALEIFSVCIEKKFGFQPEVLESYLQNMKNLAVSNLIQGGALERLRNAYFQVVKEGLKTAKEVTNWLMEVSIEGVHRHGLEGLSQCIAAVCLASSGSYASSFLNSCVELLNQQSPKTQLGALCIGEIGKHQDLSDRAEIAQSLIQMFDNRSEDLKICASVALGNLAVGNLDKYLPLIFSQFKVQSHKYLLLIALKEVISYHFQKMTPFLDTILPLLFEHSSNPEDSVRNLVAECLGRLFLISPEKIGPQLESNIQEGSVVSRVTVASSIKFAASSKLPDTSALEGILKALVSCFASQDVNLKRACMLSLNAMAQNLPKTIKHEVPEILPQVYPETQIRQDLIRKVDLGPFTHQIDDGLPVRKAAYGLLEALLEAVPEKVDPNTLTEHMLIGLDDPSEEVQMICHQIVGKLAVYGSGALSGALDGVLAPIRKNIEKQLKMINNRQDVERANDVLRSCFRCLDSIEVHVEVENNMQFKELLSYISGVPELASIMHVIKEQRETLFFG